MDLISNRLVNSWNSPVELCLKFQKISPTRTRAARWAPRFGPASNSACMRSATGSLGTSDEINTSSTPVIRVSLSLGPKFFGIITGDLRSIFFVASCTGIWWVTKPTRNPGQQRPPRSKVPTQSLPPGCLPDQYSPLFAGPSILERL